ncbi:MAG: nicotinate phosphoribosyltransferase [Acutalibacteraceae bacterium]|nr:nicotinate phosphoribosyltransferase [Acutalibacteraceae bacterium]
MSFARQNLSLLIEVNNICTSNGLLEKFKNTESSFDLYFRSVPDNGGFAILAGLSQVVELLENLHFDESDISFLTSLNELNDEFIEYLKDFKFQCDVWSIPEGTPVFPEEPVLVVKGPAIQTQLIESLLLSSINHQTLIATKANRVCRAAHRKCVVESGLRKAHSYDSALYGARASYIGGVEYTTNLLASKEFSIPTLPLMNHSFVQMFESEYDAFKSYCEIYGDKSVLLVDTYNILKSGVVNAIKVFDEVLKPKGERPLGIKIDSGDITYYTRKARKMLDDAGYPDCKIFVSNSLDEYVIRDMLNQGANVDSFVVGEKLITSATSPIFTGVYKMTSVFENDKEYPVIKLSENVSKITTPCLKQSWRLFDRVTGKCLCDVITKFDEIIDDNKDYEIFDPVHTWKRKNICNFISRPMLKQVFDKGVCVYPKYSVMEIKKYCKSQCELLWEEVKRFENPHKYYVDLSQSVWDEKRKLLEKYN